MPRWLVIGNTEKIIGMNNPELKLAITTIDSTKSAACQLCGKPAELRPYGPNGESVCFDCGMKDEDAAKRQFAKLLDGNDVVIIK